jgi:hypothetical protein
MDFYDIHDQTRFQITISKPVNMEDLSDLFVTKDELHDLVGGNVYFHGTDKRTITLAGVITTELRKWTDKLEASGKKTLLIEDEELLDVLKKGYVSEFTDDNDDRFGRHGDRICYARRYVRKKKKATQGDVTNMWRQFQCAFHDKYGCYPSHIPRYDRGIAHFKAWKEIIGWRRLRKQMHNKETVKFYRQIWDNPEEFIR